MKIPLYVILYQLSSYNSVPPHDQYTTFFSFYADLLIKFRIWEKNVFYIHYHNVISL